MRARHVLTEQGKDLARAQCGVLSASQLLDLGYSRRSLERASQEWTRLGRGVYLLTDLVDQPNWMSRVWAGVLMGGDRSCAAGPTAAVLQGLLTLEEVARGGVWLPQVALRADTDIQVLTPSRRENRPGFVFVRDVAGTHLAPSAHEPPRTRIEDTVLDLCAAGPERDAVTWLSRACQRRLTTETRILGRLSERPNSRHAALSRQILGDIGMGATTELERRVLHDVFRAHGLPEGRRQQRFRGRGHVVDIVLAEYGLVIELDGRLGHVEEGAFRDRRRDNTHTVAGAWTLRYGWQEACGAPCACAEEIARALSDRGWPGQLHRCPAC